MKKTAGLIEKLIRLVDGETLPSSTLRGDWFEQMEADGVLVTVTHGSRKSMRAISTDSLRHYLASQYNLHDLNSVLSILQADEAGRALQVNATGDSKFVRQRIFKGFLVNSYQPIDATINDVSVTLFPPDGTFVFISDCHQFFISPDVVIIGMENADNFRYIKRQKYLFSAYEKVLFVSRYPQNGDLVSWLKSIPNQYVHFGDLDLAGLAIYQNEFYRHLGERASFFLPDDFEYRISNGSLERYNAQLPQYGKMKIEDPRIEPVLACIHKEHRGYDQEGYIVG
jgi:hypothetical protein